MGNSLCGLSKLFSSFKEIFQLLLVNILILPFKDLEPFTLKDIMSRKIRERDIEIKRSENNKNKVIEKMANFPAERCSIDINYIIS